MRAHPVQSGIVKAYWIGSALLLAAVASASSAQCQIENLDRGLVAIRMDDRRTFLSWRFLGTDSDDVAFNVYRSQGDKPPVKLNVEPIGAATNFIDTEAHPAERTHYSVRPVIASKEGASSRAFVLPENAPARPYLSIPLRTPAGYTPNDASVGDLDGDGQYEIVLHQISRGRDNSRAGVTGQPILQAYKLDGTLLWQIDLGRNIREGAHYTQFMVYDLDGDGRAEIVCKTADGTADGTGKVIGDANADHRNERGYVLRGPEFLSVFEGQTGKALATTPYLPARGNVRDWGDEYGNRVDRFLACVAYLDGKRPSVVFCRGYYTRSVLAAWDFRDGKLAHRWTFDTHDGNPEHRAYAGQGSHSISVGDVDGDGRDEIVYGSMCIDDDGRPLWNTRLGHGDALHLSDMDPDRAGLEVLNIHERPAHPHAVDYRDARTGEIVWSKPSPDPIRGIAMDIDPRHRGYEVWASGDGLRGLWNARGEKISDRRPRSCNFGVWWDGDLLRELLDRTRVSKWDFKSESETVLLQADGCSSNNSSKATPALCADIFGDWREEIIWRSSDNKELRIYTTTIPTTHRLRTLMHDRQYRLSVAWQNVGYNQPTQPGFHLGDGMTPPGPPATPLPPPRLPD